MLKKRIKDILDGNDAGTIIIRYHNPVTGEITELPCYPDPKPKTDKPEK